MVHTLGALEQPEITRDYARLRLWVPHRVFVVMMGRTPTHPDSFVNVPDYITLARAERLSAPLLPPPDLSAARTAAGAALEQPGGPEGRSYVAPSVPASYRRRRSLDGACF